MGMFTGTSHVYHMGGTTGIGKFNREDLSDLITNISPTDTPFVSNIGRTKATAVQHEWMRDSLANAAANANIEGNEVTFSSASSGTREINMTQILVKSVIVSDTQDVVRKAGKGAELAYQVAKLTKELARDLEYACLQNGALVTGDATTARAMRGVSSWVSTNTSDLGTGTVTVTQGDIMLIMQKCWTSGGKPDMLICGGAQKRTISGMTTGVTKNLDARDKRFVQAIDVFETDFGVLKVMPDHFIATDDIAIIQTDLWKLAYLRPLQVKDLAKTGDATKKMLVTEVTLEALSENGNGLIIDALV
jgi:hypothetical protein